MENGACGLRRCAVAGLAYRAGDEPVSIEDLGEPEPRGALAGWVAVDGEVAIAGASSFLHGSECGIYAAHACRSVKKPFPGPTCTFTAPDQPLQHVEA